MPIVFCETRQLAEEWTYRFLAAAHAWADTEHAAAQRLNTAASPAPTELDRRTRRAAPSTAEVRAWARATGLTVPDRGTLRPEIWNAWRSAHQNNTLLLRTRLQTVYLQKRNIKIIYPDKTSA